MKLELLKILEPRLPSFGRSEDVFGKPTRASIGARCIIVSVPQRWVRGEFPWGRDRCRGKESYTGVLPIRLAGLG